MPDNLVRLSYLEWIEAEENTRQQKYTMFREYYEGEHQSQLTARQKKFLELNSNQSDWSLNFCPLVVDALSERLKVVGFGCDDNPELLWEWWQLGRMDATQSVMHTASVRDGDCYLIVEWDEKKKRPVFWHENAYDGSEGVQIIYSSERRTEPIVAVKKWIIETGVGAGETRRANLYYPDRIEKYIDHSGSWAEYQEDGREWPEPWVGKGGPLGIPVMHFRNKDQGYSYGESELEDVLPPQNWLNKTALDLVAAADTTAFRIPWMIGGKPENMSIGIGSWVYNTNPDTKVGELAPADISGLISLKESIAADIAKITRTPLSYFQLSGQVAAEGTLKQQESGLVGKVKDRQVVFGNSWEDAMMMARKLHNAFGPGGLDEEAIVSCVWADPETRNEKEHLEGLQLKQALGVPQEQLWLEMGYDATAIEQMQEQLVKEQARGARGLGAALLENERAFNGGDDEAEDMAKRVEAATALIRAGFAPEGALRATGLDPIRHLGLLPVTVKTKAAAAAEGK